MEGHEPECIERELELIRLAIKLIWRINYMGRTVSQGELNVTVAEVDNPVDDQFELAVTRELASRPSAFKARTNF